MLDESQETRNNGATKAQSYAKAILNILEDFGDERARLNAAQRAVLNILDDSAGETTQLEVTQKAVLNILDDFDIEKKKVDQINLALNRANTATEAANRELEAFSYSVAHDLRAPLRAIDGFSGMLQEDYAPRLDAEGRRLLGLICGSARMMGKLIDDLLAFSRLGRKNLEKTAVNMEALADSVVAQLRALEPRRTVAVERRPLPPAHGDASLIEQAVANLVSNALKFTRLKAGARVEIGARARPERPAYYVSDNGAGFDMRYSKKLFGVFQRLHGADEFEGTGVGLALVQRIVARHGGRVWAEGRPGEGATFYFTLPESGGDKT